MERRAAAVVSGNGRFVAFHSAGTNLVALDENEMVDVFVHDRKTGETTRVSARLAGGDADDASEGPAALSASGRFVAFESFASDIVGRERRPRRLRIRPEVGAGNVGVTRARARLLLSGTRRSSGQRRGEIQVPGAEAAALDDT